MSERDRRISEFKTVALSGALGVEMREAAERALEPMPSASIAWLAFDRAGRMFAWSPPRTLRHRARHWWRRRRGWTYYDGDGKRG